MKVAPKTCSQIRFSKLESPVTSLGFPGGSAGKDSACNAGDLGLIPGLGRYPGLEKSMDCVVHGVTKSRTC